MKEEQGFFAEQSSVLKSGFLFKVQNTPPPLDLMTIQESNEGKKDY